MAEHKIRVTESELLFLIQQAGYSNPVTAEWGSGNVIIDGPKDRWILEALLKRRTEEKED